MHKFKCQKDISFLMKVMIVVLENRVKSSDSTGSRNSPFAFYD